MDLRQRVQESLSGTHTIERELGGGGMSRVFVASEHRLGRKVVVKVLAPELAAAMSAERFEREIQLAASLQQANILPVISAGDMDGLPFYTMPFVEGESLRARLAGGAVPLAQAVDILRDVAKALSYAHERGVVHRDIKPDNILLSGRTAVVADFGIAKAIVAAQEKPAGATLTQLGTAVGTPAYMAPEQAAGDPDTDHRADIYAFGCMAYELLTGQPPFSGLPPHKLVVAHMNETPRDVRELRPDCPAPLASLVMQCLAKNPAERPADADDVLRQLDAAASLPSGTVPSVFPHGRGVFLKATAVYAAAFIGVVIVARLLVDTQGLPEWVFTGALIVMALGFPVVLFTGYTQQVARRVAQATPTLTPRGTLVRPSAQGTLAQIAVKASPHVSWTRTARGGIAALTGFALLVAGWLVLRALGIGPSGSLMAAGELKAQDRVLVAAFDASSRDSALADVVSAAVRTNLGQSRAVHVVSTGNVVGALERMQRPATSRVDLALAREIATREGIKAVVIGSVASAGTGFIITARLVSAASGDELAVVQESASSTDEIIPAVDGLTRKLRNRIGESLKSVAGAPALAQVTTSSLEALRAYAAGLRANDVDGDFPKAIGLFEDAIAKDSGFASAYVQLSYSLGNARLQSARQDSLIATAYRLRGRLPESERYALEGAYEFRRNRPRAIAAFQRAIAVDSFNVDALNELGILSAQSGQNDEATRWYRRAVALEPDNGVLLGNLAEALTQAGRFAESDSVIRAMQAKKIAYPSELHRLPLWYGRGMIDSAEAFARAGMRGPNASVARGTLSWASRLAAVRGQLREGQALGAELRARNVARGAPVDSLDLPIRAAIEEAFLRGRPQRAAAELEAAVRLHPPTPTSRAGVQLDVAQAFAMAGAPARARTFIAQWDSARRDSVQLESWRGQRRYAEAVTLLAEGKTEDAIRMSRRIDVDDDGLRTFCDFCPHLMLARSFDAANASDSTIAALERYLASTNVNRVNPDIWFRGPAHKRLGELYEAKGDTKRAATQYAAFVELWKNADADLQPKVAEVRARLAGLRRTLPQ
jgi:eukaryotic-like serine/threonine-protein kinase